MSKKKQIAGWIAVSLTVIISSILAYWGAVENFHEGWYSSIWENIFMLVFQYLLFTIVFVLLAIVMLKWKRIGLILHIATGLFCGWFFSGASFSVIGVLVIIPFIVLGLLYYYLRHVSLVPQT